MESPAAVLADSSIPGRREYLEFKAAVLANQSPRQPCLHTVEADRPTTCFNLIPPSIQSEYDPDELAPKITTQLVHKSNGITYV